jgi:hypothetical protein
MMSLHELQKFTRLQMFDIWNRMKLGEPLEGEEKIIGELMQLHTEFHDTWERIEELADYEYNPETDVNPFLHISIDSIIVNQVNQKSPPEVEQAYNRLRKKGLGHLDTIHEIDRAFLKELWPMLKYHKPFNNAGYIKKVQRL